MSKLVNRAKMTTATTGTGTITLGTAADGYQTFSAAGVVNGDVVRYVIEDDDAWEIGTGTYTSSGTTLSRAVSESSNADAAINLSGNAFVYITAAAEDFNELAPLTSPTFTGVLTVNGTASAAFFENPQTITSNYTIASGKNAMNTGPITIASGVTVTVESGSRYVVI